MEKTGALSTRGTGEHEADPSSLPRRLLIPSNRQISSGLSRPKIINREDCNARLPSLTLE